MTASHTVAQGEHLSRIAREYGFRNFNTIWDHPQNAELKKKRANPNVLNPGDTLYIPDKEQKTVGRPTAQLHTFTVPARKLMLRIVVRDFDNQPVVNSACVLEIADAKYNLTTNAQGRIEQAIPDTAEDGVLRIPSLEIDVPVKVGHLDPAEEELGWQRLINLGYHAEALSDEDDRKLRQSVEEFQCDYKMKVTGELDASTRAKLKEIHGC
jgi:N-acetylmuramoyl-L-alanine amidase